MEAIKLYITKFYSILIDNWLIKCVIAGFLTIIEDAINGHEPILSLIIFMYFVDLLTGITVAIKNKNVNSENLVIGALKIIIYGVMVLIGVGLDRVFFTGQSFHLFFFAYIFITESISVLENISLLGFQVPLSLVKYLRVKKDNIDPLEKKVKSCEELQ